MLLKYSYSNELNKQHKITLLTYYSQVNYKGAIRRLQNNVHRLPPSLSPSLSPPLQARRLLSSPYTPLGSLFTGYACWCACLSQMVEHISLIFDYSVLVYDTNRDRKKLPAIPSLRRLFWIFPGLLRFKVVFSIKSVDVFLDYGNTNKQKFKL